MFVGADNGGLPSFLTAPFVMGDRADNSGLPLRWSKLPQCRLRALRQESPVTAEWAEGKPLIDADTCVCGAEGGYASDESVGTRRIKDALTCVLESLVAGACARGETKTDREVAG
jgi:hypothetical protein